VGSARLIQEKVRAGSEVPGAGCTTNSAASCSERHRSVDVYRTETHEPENRVHAPSQRSGQLPCSNRHQDRHPEELPALLPQRAGLPRSPTMSWAAPRGLSRLTMGFAPKMGLLVRLGLTTLWGSNHRSSTAKPVLSRPQLGRYCSLLVHFLRLDVAPRPD
jgi:hypothetical protein